MNEMVGRSAMVTGGSHGIGRAVVERLLGDGTGVVAIDLEVPGDLGVGDGSPRSPGMSAGGRTYARPSTSRFATSVASTSSSRSRASGRCNRCSRSTTSPGSGCSTSTSPASSSRVQEGARAMVTRRPPRRDRGPCLRPTPSTPRSPPPTTPPAREPSSRSSAPRRSTSPSHGIRINAVAPGMIRTRMAAPLTEDPEAAAEFLRKRPAGPLRRTGRHRRGDGASSSRDRPATSRESLVIADGGLTVGMTLGTDEIGGADLTSRMQTVDSLPVGNVRLGCPWMCRPTTLPPSDSDERRHAGHTGAAGRPRSGSSAMSPAARPPPTPPACASGRTPRRTRSCHRAHAGDAGRAAIAVAKPARRSFARRASTTSSSRTRSSARPKWRRIAALAGTRRHHRQLSTATRRRGPQSRAAVARRRRASACRSTSTPGFAPLRRPDDDAPCDRDARATRSRRCRAWTRRVTTYRGPRFRGREAALPEAGRPRGRALVAAADRLRARGIGSEVTAGGSLRAPGWARCPASPRCAPAPTSSTT